MDWTKIDKVNSVKKDVSEGILSQDIFSCRIRDNDNKKVECGNHGGAGTDSKLIMGENSSH